MNLKIPNQIISLNGNKNLVQNKLINNKLLNSEDLINYYIEKDYELKSNYFNLDGKEITNDVDLWKESIFNKSNIKFMWDNKTNLFAFNFSFTNKNIDEILFSINNGEISKTIKPDLKYINSEYKQQINCFDLSESLNDIKKIRTIQITLKNKECSRVISIVLNQYKFYKQDYFITKNKKLLLNFQNSIIINGDNVKPTFSYLMISPIKLKQGFWNKDILLIENESNDVFCRNSINLNSLENLPITSSSKSSFLANIVNDNNLSSTIRIEQNTYYDLNKKETIKGFGLNSNSGYLPPFEFSGLFFPILDFNVNGANLKISWEESFDKPYFKNEEGINKIYLDYSYNYDQDTEWLPISMELLDEAKKYNFTFSEFKKWLSTKK